MIATLPASTTRSTNLCNILETSAKLTSNVKRAVFAQAKKRTTVTAGQIFQLKSQTLTQNHSVTLGTIDITHVQQTYTPTFRTMEVI